MTIIYILLFVFSIVNAKPVRVIIAGGGPAGLLAAHCFLSRGDMYDVKILEARQDPNSAIEATRTYSLGLNIRGQTGIKYFDRPGCANGLLQGIRDVAVESDSFFVHIGKRKLQIRKKSQNKDSGPPPTLLVSRNKLSSVMLNNIIANYGSSGRVEIEFGSKVSDVNFNSKEVILDNGSMLGYDILIGADGVRSAVRTAMSTQLADTGFRSEESVLPGQFKVLLQHCPPGLEGDAVHAMNNKAAGFGLFIIPATDNKVCALINWNSQSTPPVLVSDSPEALSNAIAECYPQFGTPDMDAVKQVLQQRPSEARQVRCNRYHDVNAGVIILGDAAHSTGGTLGQGANSALLDVVTLDKCMDAARGTGVGTGIDWPSAQRMFSQQQVPEGLALWELLQLPPKGSSGVLYAVTQTVRGSIGKRIGMKAPVQALLSQTLTPFSEIVRQNEKWVNKALRSKGLERISPSTQ